MGSVLSSDVSLPTTPDSGIDRSSLVGTIRRAGDGDRSALNELADHCLPQVESFLTRRAADHPKALANQVVAELLQRLPQLNFDSPETFWSYLYNIARSRLADEKRRRVEPPIDPAQQVDLAGGQFEQNVADKLFVDGLVAGLTDGQRQVIQLRFHDDLTIDETARRLGKTPAAVKALQRRALAAMAAAAAIALAVVVAAITLRLVSDSAPRVESQDPADVSEQGPDSSGGSVDRLPDMSRSGGQTDSAVPTRPESTDVGPAGGEGPTASADRPVAPPATNRTDNNDPAPPPDMTAPPATFVPDAEADPVPRADQSGDTGSSDTTPGPQNTTTTTTTTAGETPGGSPQPTDPTSTGQTTTTVEEAGPGPTLPVVVDDVASEVLSLAMQSIVIIDVLENDGLVIDPATLRIVEQPAVGQAGVVDRDGRPVIRYQAVEPGTVVFRYEACDPQTCHTGTVTVEVVAGDRIDRPFNGPQGDYGLSDDYQPTPTTAPEAGATTTTAG